MKRVSTTRFARRGAAYVLVAAAGAVPRLATLLHERGVILDPGWVEKSDIFARTFVGSGTFGYVPNHPSADTQPLYSFFLIPIYWLFGRSWLSVGLAQIALAIVAALLVYEVGRRTISARAGVGAALISTLHPYLVWHDVHVAREIVDQVALAALVLLTLLVAERPTLRRAALLGVVAGVAILGNVRLVALPLVLGGYLLWRLGRSRRTAGTLLVILAATLVALTPWVVRNRVQVGCVALTTDANALWRANNPNTYRTLTTAGYWIDQVPQIQVPRAIRGDECSEMRFYRRRVLDFWRDHPVEKLRLARLATVRLWDPRPIKYVIRPAARSKVDTGRSWVEPLFMSAVYALALVGVAVARRPLTVLVVVLLAYQTLMAMVFTGTTRYRVPWDFLLAVLAAGALSFVRERVRLGWQPLRRGGYAAARPRIET
jgi:4-amino-4-deoxy-L-arabinose transferase-like glycosyltransferase